MNIGIIVFSGTGNTLSVAHRLKEKLVAVGHSVILEQIKVSGYKQGEIRNLQFIEIPDAGKFDRVIFAAPVQAFSLSPVMKKYFSQTGSLQDKKTACFVTQHFPYTWMGGNQAVGWIRRACLSKGAEVLGTGIVNWSRKDREKRIAEVIDRICGLF